MADDPIAFNEAFRYLQSAKVHYDNRRLKECLEDLKYAKLQFLSFKSYFNPKAISATWKQEVMVVRDVFEYECLCAARTGDVQSFNSAFARLRSYYTDFQGSDIETSTRQMLLMGLNLLCLLVQNRVAEFHAQMELVPAEQHSSLYVKPVVELERYLMEGTYTKLLQARQSVPTNDYEQFLDQLTQTVSAEIARCMSQSYNSIQKDAAAKLLMCDGTKGVKVEDVIEANGWKLDQGTGRITFQDGVEAADANRLQVNFAQMIDDHLTIAFELQRIV